jgi:hypothetical protein
MSDRYLQRRGAVVVPAVSGVLVETDTYTPTYYGLSSAGTTTYSTRQGQYVRIGNLVIAQFNITWTAATGTGNAAISLPYPAAAGYPFAIPIYTADVTFAATGVMGLVQTGTNYVLLGTPTSNAATATLAVEAAGTIIGTAIYMI